MLFFVKCEQSRRKLAEYFQINELALNFDRVSIEASQATIRTNFKYELSYKLMSNYLANNIKLIQDGALIPLLSQYCEAEFFKLLSHNSKSSMSVYIDILRSIILIFMEGSPMQRLSTSGNRTRLSCCKELLNVTVNFGVKPNPMPNNKVIRN